MTAHEHLCAFLEAIASEVNLSDHDLRAAAQQQDYEPALKLVTYHIMKSQRRHLADLRRIEHGLRNS